YSWPLSAAIASTRYSRASTDEGATVKRDSTFSPARENVNGTLVGDDVQPRGSLSVNVPEERDPAPTTRLLISSTETSRCLSGDASGMIAVRGVTLTASGGTTISSRSSSPYGSCSSRRRTAVRTATAT